MPQKMVEKQRSEMYVYIYMFNTKYIYLELIQ